MQIIISPELQKKTNDLYQKALNLHRSGHLAEAQSGYRAVINLDAKHFGALHMLGVAMFQTQQPDEAVRWISKAIEIDPKVVSAHVNIAMAYTVLGRYEEADTAYLKALKLNPSMPEIYVNRCILLQEMKRTDEALDACEKAISLKPDLAEAHLNFGSVLQELNRIKEALTSYDQAIKINPNLAQAHNNKGNALREVKSFNEALLSYERAIEINPAYYEAHSNKGNVLQDMGLYDRAIQSYEDAIKIQSKYIDAYNNKGNALLKMERYEDAFACYDEVLKVNPNHADAHNNKGNVFKELARFGEALTEYEHAISLRPDHAAAYNNIGGIWMGMGREADAISAYKKAIELKPDFLLAQLNMGDALRSLKNYEGALHAYQSALLHNPNSLMIKGIALHTKMAYCNWTAFDEEVASFIYEVGETNEGLQPFPILTFVDDPVLHKKVAINYVSTAGLELKSLGEFRNRTQRRKIRVGYFSADFHNHATSHLMAELFELHDRERFELYAFSYGPNENDETRARLISSFDQFIDVRGKSDRDVALLSRELEVDIAVDLKGYTKDARTAIFGYRCAPIQVNYLGYPGTMGANFIDYIVADRVLIPDGSLENYAEKVIRLPHSYQVNDGKRQISDHVFTREQLGLPLEGFVYCCFNNNYKIVPNIFNSWMRILSAVEGSVLWLFEDNLSVVDNLRKEAHARGVDPSRLVFAKFIPLKEHLARLRVADLFLDTLPYNAHTTASDALWVGLPVLTQIGNSFAARVAASLLNAIGMPELVMATSADYEAKAIELATHHEMLSNLKFKLIENKVNCPLFNAQLFAKGLEAAYIRVFERLQSNLSPEHIDVV